MTRAPNDPAPPLELLARYLRGDLSDNERRQVESWLAGDPTRTTELEDLRLLLGASGVGPEWDLDRVWRGIEDRIRPHKPTRALPPTPRFTVGTGGRWSGPARAAAAAVVIGSGAAGAMLLRPRVELAPSPPTVIATTRAQRLALRLSDSTQVVLAPESRLEVPPDYGRAKRQVRLEGEAAFTVVHDSTRPFAVETQGAIVRDLGTRFLVRNYASDSATDVVVAEGLVAVGGAGAAETLVVARGELARVGSDGRVGVTRGVSLDRYFAWTEGRIVFNNTPLLEVAAQLERWYDVEVRLANPRLGARRVTASFQGENPAEILRLLAALTGLQVVSDGRIYTVRGKP